MKRTKAKLNKQALKRLLSLALPYWGAMTVALIALALGSGINLLFPEIIRRILNSDGLELLFRHPTKIAGAFIGLFALQGVCFYFRSYLFGVIGQRVVSRIRKDLYHAIIREDIETFDTARVGDLVSRISSDAALIQDAVSLKLSVFIRYSFQVLVGIILMALLSLRLTFAIVVSLVILVGFSIFLGKRLKSISRLQQAELGRATAIAEETISGVRTVKAFNQEALAEKHFGQSIDLGYAHGIKRSGIAAFFSSFVNFLMNGSLILVLLYGVYLATEGRLSFGDLTSFLLYGGIVAISFAFVITGYGEFLQALGGAERIFEYLDRHTEHYSEMTNILGNRIRGEIQFKDVSFSYPSRSEIEVLRALSFTIPSGKTTALVGQSGSGKTSIVNLLLKFYSPLSGQISIDGHPLSSVSPYEIRDHIAVVPQELRLFAVSIGENLRYGKEDATEGELERACKQANILEFINSLPERFDTMVGESGVQLSGGQKQRIAIARALLRNPEILILDEATSALDSENEFLIQEAVSELMRDRTVIIITHRLASLRRADYIIVLEDGEIRESGTYPELSARKGILSELLRMSHSSRSASAGDS